MEKEPRKSGDREFPDCKPPGARAQGLQSDAHLHRGGDMPCIISELLL